MDAVKFFMSEPTVRINSQASVLETVKKMRDDQVGSILITNDDEFVGIFTETDLLRKVAAEKRPMENIRVSDVMSHPLVSIDHESSMIQAFLTMQQRNIRHLTVSEKNKIVGILSIKDVANYYVGKFAKK